MDFFASIFILIFHLSLLIFLDESIPLNRFIFKRECGLNVFKIKIYFGFLRMILVHTVDDLRSSLSKAKSVALVPTMGNLHAGHLDLVENAKARAELVVTSIFVNRLQFAPHEDFDSYPRTLEQDRAKLESVGCDVIFAPSERALYPVPQTFKVHPGADLGDILEGEFRPGFFTGVCTVVSKLFNCVQPQLAFFGKKYYPNNMSFLILGSRICERAHSMGIFSGLLQFAPSGISQNIRRVLYIEKIYLNLKNLVCAYFCL